VRIVPPNLGCTHRWSNWTLFCMQDGNGGNGLVVRYCEKCFAAQVKPEGG